MGSGHPGAPLRLSLCQVAPHLPSPISLLFCSAGWIPIDCAAVAPDAESAESRSLLPLQLSLRRRALLFGHNSPLMTLIAERRGGGGAVPSLRLFRETLVGGRHGGTARGDEMYFLLPRYLMGARCDSVNFRCKPAWRQIRGNGRRGKKTPFICMFYTPVIWVICFCLVINLNWWTNCTGINWILSDIF